MATHQTPNVAEKKRRTKKRKSRLEVSSSGGSDSEVETKTKSKPAPGKEQAKNASPVVESKPVTSKKVKKKPEAPPEEDEDIIRTEMPLQPSLTPKPNSIAQAQEDFSAVYLRKITTELADDLDKVREAKDFKASSVPMLIHALKQGESLFTAEEKRRVVGAANV